MDKHRELSQRHNAPHQQRGFAAPDCMLLAVMLMGFGETRLRSYPDPG
jgi:hypothetical protein